MPFAISMSIFVAVIIAATFTTFGVTRLKGAKYV